MGYDANEAIIGMARIEYGGVDLGLTTEDGVTYAPEVEVKELRAAQTMVVTRVHKVFVVAKAKAKLLQLSLEKWQLIEDLASAPAAGVLSGAYNPNPTPRALVLTLPGPNGSTRVMTATAIISTPGEMVFANNEYTGCEVEWMLIGNPQTNSYWNVVESAGTTTAPVPASFQYIVSAGTETAFVDGAVNIPKAAVAVQVTFNVPIRPDQITGDHFLLKEASGNAMVAATYSYGVTTGSRDFTKVKIVAALSASTAYDLIVPPGVLSMDGVRGAGAAVQFTTTT